MNQRLLIVLAVCALGAGSAAAQPGPGLDDETLGAQRGGIATPLGFDIGFGASVRTYVDGSLALETRLVWTDTGVQTERVFEGAVAGVDTSARTLSGQKGSVAPGQVRVIHDLTENRIGSLVVSRGNDHTIRQETDITLRLPDLPRLQEQIAAIRLGASLQASAAGVGR